MFTRFKERARRKLQWALREVLEEHTDDQRQWWEKQLDARQACAEDERQRREGVRAAQHDERHAALTAEITALRAEHGVLRGELEAFEVRTRRDLCYATEVTAARESALLVQEQMPSARLFPRPEDTLRYAAELVEVTGSVLEFGVASGHTLNLLAAALPGRTVAGFDVFTGLPEDWRSGFPAGTFGQETIPEVPGAEVVVGLFADTLPEYLARNLEPIALLHVDADLYSSARTVLELVGPRLVVGSVVLFDEYFNYSGWQHGEYLAWQQYVERTGTTFRYAGYTYDHEQVVVVVTGRQPSG
ncbi:MAG: class I SAM-dependent methyltransferase [Mycobacteriaceae bacterium]